MDTGVIHMADVWSDISSAVMKAAATVKDTTETTAAATTESKLDKLFQTTEKAEQLSSSIMDIIYILIAMVIVVAIFTVTLYVYKFINNRRDPNYKKNDDTFLDD